MKKVDVTEAAQYFEGVFTIDPKGLVIVDHEGIILRVNPAFANIFGYNEHEILGKPFDTVSYKNQKMQKITSHNSLHRFYCSENASLEMTFFDKQGCDIPVRFRAFLIRDKHGKIKQAIGMVEHMAGLNGTGGGESGLAEKMWEAQQNFDNVLNNSADVIVMCDISGNIMMANKAFSQMLDYKQEDVRGKHIAEFTAFVEGTYATTTGEDVIIDEEYVTETASKPAELFERGYVSNWESYLVKKDNVHVPAEITMSVLKDKEGNRRGSVVIVRDITERRKAERERERTEREIKDARDFLENIFKTTSDGIMVTDPEGYITMVNDATEKMLGYSKDELIGMHPTELGIKGSEHEKKREEFSTQLQEEGLVHGFEHTWLRKDRSFVDVGMNVTFLKDTQGNITGAVASIRDITEQKRSEKEIREAKDFLENIFRTSVDGIFVTNDKGVITIVNKAVEKMLGYSKDELIGKHASELVPEGKEYEEEGMEMMKKLHVEGFVAGRERILSRKDGSLIDIEQSSTFLKDKEGNLTGSMSSFRDITERKQVREALKKSEEMYHNLIEFANVGIIVSEKNRIMHVNKNAEEIYGYSKEELIGQSPSILVPEKYRKKHKKVLDKTLKKDKEIKTIHEEEGIRKDGTVFPLEISFTLTQPQENTIIAVMRDITERKKMETQLAQSEKLKSLGELSGGVAHDFNNVLAAILGRVQLLKMQFKPPSGKQEKRKSMLDLIKSLDIIERASLDGAETVRRIQEFSRKRVDDKEFAKIDINELVDNALDFTKMRWKNDAESKGIKITIQKEFSPLPPTSGSASELREVFTNLINNAIDAMPKGGCIKIKTFKENGHISITIEDTGVGISEVIRNRIFDPFFTTKGVQSTGLGMSVSYGIINRHGGTIGVDSVEGKGTTFAITLPISDNIRVGKEKTKPIPEEKRKSTILVIEDEEEVRNLLADILIENGHQVETASDGKQGIDIFKKKDFDLVFTDLGMPGTSGWEVAETVKSINERIPVAIITGWNVELKETEMRERGVNLIAYKPFKIDQILRLVQEGMELKEHFEAA